MKGNREYKFQYLKMIYFCWGNNYLNRDSDPAEYVWKWTPTRPQGAPSTDYSCFSHKVVIGIGAAGGEDVLINLCRCLQLDEAYVIVQGIVIIVLMIDDSGNLYSKPTEMYYMHEGTVNLYTTQICVLYE